ncbi:hypothetical protein [Actinoplanes awajinensis]|uniref:Secreted protein n=1 Tax=Actinoplanes awajinensis subsp. mycoplanecinus TaxID=135947 RepID=A0A101JNC2_9ACTN|nr:hypothetical protein [Actinoplanes awajinensis]KUL29974.1 hypothetical protein ADL15_25710 [Actinoplanes awajinensis subsp. mycoplanecinus]
MPELTWEIVARLAYARDSAALTGLLLDASEAERLAFGPVLESGIRATREDDWWHGSSPGGGLALAAIACLPTAARVAALLGRGEMRRWPEIPADRFLEIAAARGLPWLGDLGVRLADRLPRRDVWPDTWRFADTLLATTGAVPPITEGFVRGWLRAVHESRWTGRPTPLADCFRDSRWLDLLLPHVFERDELAGELSPPWFDGTGWTRVPAFPGAIAELVADGRLERTTVLDATVDRLLRGGKATWLRPFALLHDELAPTVDELAGHAADYARLLGGAPPPVAGLAQRALRVLDDAGRLEVTILLEAGAGALTRPEKTLVTAELAALERLVRRLPDGDGRVDEVLETMAGAFHHPSLDLREMALARITGLSTRLTPGGRARLAEASAVLTGEAATRAAALFTPAAPPLVRGGPPLAPAGPPLAPAGWQPASPAAVPDLAVAPRAAPAPPPIGTPAELAEEIVALVHDETSTGWERVLAGLITLAAADGLAAVLTPVLLRYPGQLIERRWGRLVFLGEAIRAATGATEVTAATRVAWQSVHDSTDPSLIDMPDGVLTLRVAEIAARWAAGPVPLLLAIPTRVDGSIDAATLVTRMASAEAGGWEPWPLDFEQALLRVGPATEAVLDRAAGLGSARGRQLAAWLRSGGLPDPVSTPFEQASHDREGRLVARRVVAVLDSGRNDDAGLVLETALVTLVRRPRPGYDGAHEYRPDILAAVLPRHREVIAAWALPDLAALAALADADGRDATLLPLLAECSGPAGPALVLAVTYGLGARHEPDRVAATDAFLLLSAESTTAALPGAASFTTALGTRPGAASFTTAVGARLGDLGADGTVKLGRVTSALTNAAGSAPGAVWAVLSAALPPLLRAPHTPRNLPDLLELGTHAAGASHARGEITELAAVAGRSGGSRLVREAKRLHGWLTR